MSGRKFPMHASHLARPTPLVVLGVIALSMLGLAGLPALASRLASIPA